MKELKEILDQLEVVSYDDYTKELSASENALVIVGNVQKLKGSEDCIIVSPLNNVPRKFQFKTQDIEKIETIENQVFKVFIKVDSSCIVMTSGRTKKRNAATRNTKKFDFRKMKLHANIKRCDVFCDSCVVTCDINCDSCVVTCDCDCYTDCYSECICDCNYVA